MTTSQAEELGVLSGFIALFIMAIVFFNAYETDKARIEAEAEQVRIDSIAQMRWFDDDVYIAPHWSLPEGKGKGFILKGSGTGRGIYAFPDTTIIITKDK